jgi:hypothetical protein
MPLILALLEGEVHVRAVMEMPAAEVVGVVLRRAQFAVTTVTFMDRPIAGLLRVIVLIKGRFRVCENKKGISELLTWRI